MAGALGALVAVAAADDMSGAAIVARRKALLAERRNLDKQDYNRKHRHDRLADKLVGVHDADLQLVLGQRLAKRAKAKAKATPKAKAAGKATAKAKAKAKAKAADDEEGGE